ncbi:AAA family ATPase [Lacipirellula parvula]|uniref:DNA helicase DnaB-like N-terminal domain-containing protein n=1 Tax=Lacipirellula parvula TaxID=2650471 RepID=A0A5K7XG57_9BACT|nr:AAA family ATPase [Lacipirellula parvula]BBO31949.1 hypothetical protein PLANPX_1561 [Lacipirellula parvula]
MKALATDRERLPTALDAERQVIGGLLLEPSQAPKLLRTLQPAAFVDQLNRATLAAIAEMSRLGEPIDVATLLSRLQDRVEFADTSAAAYLADVGRSCVTATNVAYHASLIAEAHLKRRIHLAAREIASSALNGHAGDDLLADWGATFEDFRREQTGGNRFKPITAAELAAGDFRVNWIIDWLLVEGQPCILAGGKKCLKTTILCDLLLSIAVGGCFLGQFEVRSARRVVLFSAESGAGVLQETCRRIAASKGWELADVPNFTLITDVPRLDCSADMAAFEAAIEDAEVIALDPCYLMMPGGDAGNLFVQGEMLLNLSRLCQRLGVTLILCHHTRKHRSADLNSFDPPELEDIAWAGFQEFARQWVLVGRRERYVADSGEHSLWMNYGGSAGHGGLWALDASEGSIGDVSGRRWDVTLSKAQEVREQAERRRDDDKARRSAQQLEGDVRAVVDALARLPEQSGTKTDLKDATGLYQSRFSAAIASALQDNHIIPMRITKGNNQSYDGYRLSLENHHPDTPG